MKKEESNYESKGGYCKVCTGILAGGACMIAEIHEKLLDEFFSEKRNQIIQYIETIKDINHEAKSYQERRDQLEFVRGYGSALNELSDYIKSLTP